jgi:hypothetical protein
MLLFDPSGATNEAQTSCEGQQTMIPGSCIIENDGNIISSTPTQASRSDRINLAARTVIFTTFPTSQQ